MAQEFWLHGFPIPGHTVGLAVQAESWGFDGLLLADSEILVGDPYVELALAAQATTTLRLGPAVTNPVTRHPAVTAAAIGTLQVESGGRAALILGRGDSAVLQLGLQPARTTELQRALIDIQDYLRGADVPQIAGGTARMAWLQGFGLAQVPVSLAATGPATIVVGARYAHLLDFTVGADPQRIGWAVDLAQRTATENQRSVSLGAFVNFAVHPDIAMARDLIRGSAAIFAHFVSEGPTDQLSAPDREVIGRLGSAYEEASHGLASAKHATVLPDEFLDRFAVVGPPDQCIERLRTLMDLGLDRLIMVPASRDADPQLVTESNERFASQVLPKLRR